MEPQDEVSVSEELAGNTQEDLTRSTNGRLATNLEMDNSNKVHTVTAGPKNSPKNRYLGTIAQLCRAISLQLRHALTMEKTY